MELSTTHGEPQITLRTPLEKIAGVVSFGGLYLAAKRPGAVTSINGKRYNGGANLRYLEGVAKTMLQLVVDRPETEPLIVSGQEDLLLLGTGAGHFVAGTPKQRARDCAKSFNQSKKLPPPETLDRLVPIMRRIDDQVTDHVIGR